MKHLMTGDRAVELNVSYVQDPLMRDDSADRAVGLNVRVGVSILVN